jgi:hypothetical protein
MATAVPVFEERRVSIGRVFQRAFSTIAHNPLVVLGLALVLGALPSALFSYVTRSMAGPNAVRLANGDMTKLWGAMFFSWIVGVVISAIVQAALTRAIVAENEGHRATFGDCIAAGLRVFLPLIVVGLIYGVAIGLGFILLVVPGILLMVMWSVAAPSVVVERDGILQSFSRSMELTKGHRWKILGLFLVLLVIYILAFWLLGIVGLSTYGAANFGEFGVVNAVASIVTAMIFNLIWGTIQPALYIELRQAKEGDSMENLEQVFA